MPFYHGLKNYADDPIYPDKQTWIAERLLTLRWDLHQQIIKDRKENSLIIGSWNLVAFDGGLPRLDESYHYIAEIIGSFDICAVQEVRPDLGPLKRLVDLLGPNWDYLVTDASTHTDGNNERIAILFDRNKVRFRNLVGEVVIDPDQLPSSTQFARSPFFATFQAGWFRFTLCSVHITFGGTTQAAKQQRADEIALLTEMLLKRARDEDQVYVLLGDMNIEKADGPIMKALTDTAYRGSKMDVPNFPPTNLGGDKHFDQIAFTLDGQKGPKTQRLREGAFDWRTAVFGPWPAGAQVDDTGAWDGVSRLTHDQNLLHYRPINDHQRQNPPQGVRAKAPYADFARSYTTFSKTEMSDHLPVWVELEVDYSNDYLLRFVDD